MSSVDARTVTDDPDPSPTVRVGRPSPPAPRQASAVPSVVAGVEIVGVLGRGAMGVVYQGRQPGLNRLVAVKVVRRAEDADEHSRARVRREAEAVARLSHPNIVRIHAVAEHDGLPVLILEYVPGRTLDRLIDGRPQPVRAAARWVEAMARAMAHAHSQGVLHRDLKPANVLMEGDDTPRVTDFGLARDLAAPSATVSDLAGTPAYMAPEQAAGRVSDLCPATDVHALGAILYELLVGRPPFAGEDIPATLRQVTTLEPIPPSRLRQGLPRDLETICLKCLRKEPSRRYATAAELADDLAAFLEGRPVKARPVGAAERLWRAARRHPAVTAMLLLTAASVIAGVAVFVVKQAETEAARAVAVDKAKLAESRLARLALDRGLTLCEAGDVRPGLLWLGRALEVAADAGADDLDGPVRANIAAWRGGLVQKATTCDHTTRLAASPDSALIGPGLPRSLAVCPKTGRIATACHTGRILFWHADGRPDGPPLRNGVFTVRTVRTMAFSPDGKYLATGNSIGEVRAFEVESRRAVGGTRRHGSDDVWRVSFAPDGKTFVSAGSDGVVRQWSVADGKPAGPDLNCGEDTRTYAVAHHPSRPVVFAGGREGVVHDFGTAAPGNPPRTVIADRVGVYALTVSPDGGTLIVCGEGSARLYDTATLTPHGRPLEHAGRIAGAAVSPDGSLCVTAGHDGVLRFWRVADGTPVGEVVRTFSRLTDVAFLPDGNRVAVLEHGGKMALCSVPADHVVRVSPRLRSAVRALHPFDDRTVAAVTYPEVTLVDAADGVTRGAWVAAFGKPNRDVLRLPDGRAAVCRYNTENVILIDPARGATPTATLPQKGDPAELRYAAGANRLLARSESESLNEAALFCWDVSSPERPVYRIPGVGAIGVSPDGTLVACAVGGTVRVRRAADGEAVAGPMTHADPVTAVAVGDDGRLVLTGRRDGGLRLWRDGAIAGKPFNHRGEVRAVSMDADGRTAVTASADGSARWWDVATGVALGPALWHNGPVNALVVVEGGAVLTAADDERVRMMRRPTASAAGTPAEIVRELEALTGRRLTDGDVLEAAE